ncbi:hypothetical protein V501_04809 [Pseudogymnoascus sp. VKM F-4519 (FW-2642)]|nr:hypothetical protein V501_04809 [Pseudogymnoascus sp. VKM F-4519 (FW-2642)]
MQFSKLLPLAALFSLAIARDSADVRARFTKKGSRDEFDITSYLCENFEKTQPIYDEILVGPYVCRLYTTRNCGDPVVETFPRGIFKITELEFKAVQCIDA